jgi:hypothetical protein
MANVAVTCIKNGRSDSFGRPLVSGTYYPSVEIETAKALWNSGYVSVADASVFDQDPLAGTSPLDDFNIARALSLSRQPAQTSANLAAELAALGGYAQLSPKAGLAGNYGYGVGPCPFRLPAGFTPMSGVSDPLSEGSGGYLTPDGSVMRWIPAEYRKWGTGSNNLAVNVLSALPITAMSLDEATNQGYYVPAEFYRSGIVQPGFFIDQFGCSAGLFNGNLIAKSVKGGVPLSVSTIGTLVGAPSATIGGIFAACKTRGEEYFPPTVAMYRSLAYMALGHGQKSQSSATCAWYDESEITNFPKGNNNNAYGDSAGTGVSYSPSGTLTIGLTGSGVPFDMTTHNGQRCGIADLNGNMREFGSGLISHGGQYYALSLSADISSMTGGVTLSTDHWGAAGLAASFTNIGATYGAMLGSATAKLMGNASQVFDSQVSGVARLAQSYGLPLVGGVGGTNLFGSDGLDDYRWGNGAATTGGHYGDTTRAGIWYLSMNASYDSVSAHYGFRCARYLDAGVF